MRQKLKKNLSLYLVFFILFTHSALIQADKYGQLDPLQTVRTLVATTINQIRTLKSKGGFNHSELRSYIQKEALPRFDLRSITQTLMGDYYSVATDGQQNSFMDAFSDRLLQIYSNSLKDLDNNQILFKRDFQFLNDGRALVRTLLVTENNTRVPIEYYLRETTNVGWLIYDIQIDGMSIMATYRPSFKNQFDSKSIDQVIADLNNSNSYLDNMNDKKIKEQN